MLRAAWHSGGDSSSTRVLLGTPGNTLLYLCLPPIKGSVGIVRHFLIAGGNWVESCRHKSLLNTRTFLYRGTCLNLVNRVAASLANHPGELVCPENIGMLSVQHHKHLSNVAWEWQGWGVAITGKPAEVPPMAKSLQYLGLLGENSKKFGQVRWVLRA
jgi:hypothetical protein